MTDSYYDEITSSISDGLDWAGNKLYEAWDIAADGALPDDNTLSQKQYGFNYKTFPSDLGMSYNGHYMVININVPVTLTTGRGGSTQIATDLPGNATLLPDELSKVDVLRFGSKLGGWNVSQTDSVTSRRTRRIKESIALYMPGTQLVFNGMNAYEEISMTALSGQLATGIISKGVEFFASYVGGRTLVGQALKEVLPSAAELGAAAGGASDTIQNLASGAAKLAGRPINPRVEVLFASTPLRDFQFEFLFMPRNAEESKSVREIIKTIRYHAAPELDNFGVNFIPPAEFDITFFQAGKENVNIPRINTCVLTRCEIDYAPGTGQFSTYNDGMPIATRMMLVFREVEPIHKLRVLQGF